MEELQSLVNKAWELKKNGDLANAFICYSNAFDILIKDAHGFARNQPFALLDIGELRVATEVLKDEAKKFLKQDKTAAVISNNMGTILAELGDPEGASKMFKQAIELTPENDEYADPVTGLNELNKL